jgi:hypothetical protein
LISDRELQLAQVLRLPTFVAGGRTFYKRLTLIADKGTITRVFYPVLGPDENAGEAVDWIASRDTHSGAR